MGQLIAKLMGIFGNQEHKVIIVGLDNAGKTTILYQLLMTEVIHTSPTIGSNAEKIVLQKTHFLVWDIGGQEALCSTWNTYYANTEFIILVIDSTDPGSAADHAGGVVSDAGPRGSARCFRPDLCQQAGYEELHDHRGDLSIPHS